MLQSNQHVPFASSYLALVTQSPPVDDEACKLAAICALDFSATRIANSRCIVQRRFAPFPIAAKLVQTIVIFFFLAAKLRPLFGLERARASHLLFAPRWPQSHEQVIEVQPGCSPILQRYEIPFADLPLPISPLDFFLPRAAPLNVPTPASFACPKNPLP